MIPRLGPPCKTLTITCGFWCYPFHYADDLAAVLEPSWAMHDGIVITADTNVVYCEREGMYIEIRDPVTGAISRQFHLSQVWVHVGQSVLRGQQIGVTGNTGYIRNSNGTCSPYGYHQHVALGFPTKEQALETGWETPMLTAYGWAVSPIYALYHQQQEEDVMTPEQEKRLLARIDAVAGVNNPGFMVGEPTDTNPDTAANVPAFTVRHLRAFFQAIKAKPDFIRRKNNGGEIFVLIVDRFGAWKCSVSNPPTFHALGGEFTDAVIRSVEDHEFDHIPPGPPFNFV